MHTYTYTYIFIPHAHACVCTHPSHRPVHEQIAGQTARHKNAVRVQATATATRTPASKPDAYITRPVNTHMLYIYTYIPYDVYIYLCESMHIYTYTHTFIPHAHVCVCTHPSHRPVHEQIANVFLQQDGALDPFEGDNDPFEADFFKDDPLLDAEFGFLNQTAEQPKVFRCAACGEHFQMCDAYPKNNNEWDSKDDGYLRCGPCFDKRSREEYVPTLEKEVTKELERSTNRAERAGTDVDKNAGKKKKKNVFASVARLLMPWSRQDFVR